MSFEYEETSEDLQTRIDIHQQYGSRDIDAWMLELLQPAPGSRILDVGCGSGKQCRAFYEYLDGELDITGGDVNPELLSQARQLVGEFARIEELDFNQPFPASLGEQDLVSCCFAIYYANSPEFTVGEMYKVLKNGGRLFTTGPMPENKALFYEIIREATGQSIPPMPGSSRYNFSIREAIEKQFSELELHVFENPLIFRELGPFLQYTRASLAEDRKLWRPLFESERGFNEVMAAIEESAGRRLERDGQLVMTKVVGGFIATK